jgi:hypothetical protein
MAKKQLPYDSPYESSAQRTIHEEDLTKENCSPLLRAALGNDTPEITDEEYERFLNP